MAKSRVLWALWLLASLLFCLAADSTAGVLLPCLSVLLPVLSGGLTWTVRKRIRAELAMGAYGEKGKTVSGRLSVENKGFFPADRLLCQMNCENLLTGERERMTLRMAVPARKRVFEEWEFSSLHAGRIRVTLQKLVLFDLFGLFRFSVELPGEISAMTLFSPDTFPVDVQLAYGESANMDSDEYSMKKAGYDPSETFAIREYQPGDRIRQIHWKMTEKFDQLMVRDYGLPIQNTILLLLETGLMSPPDPKTADCLDALAGAIWSVSQELASQQIVHSVGWQNHEENTFACVEVESEEDLKILLPGLLGAVPGQDSMTVAEHYMESREQLEFAHMVLFTCRHSPSLGFLAEQCLLTEVICEPGLSGYDSQEGIALVFTGPDTLAESLAYLEI